MTDDQDWQARVEPGYVGLHVEPDVCGTLPSGEHCSLDHGHRGEHRKVRVTDEPTNYQEDCFVPPRTEQSLSTCPQCGALRAACRVDGRLWWDHGYCQPAQ